MSKRPVQLDAFPPGLRSDVAFALALKGYSLSTLGDSERCWYSPTADKAPLAAWTRNHNAVSLYNPCLT